MLSSEPVAKHKREYKKKKKKKKREMIKNKFIPSHMRRTLFSAAKSFVYLKRNWEIKSMGSSGRAILTLAKAAVSAGPTEV